MSATPPPQGFFDFICLPFYRAVASALPPARAQVDAIEANLRCWGEERHVAEDGPDFLSLRKREVHCAELRSAAALLHPAGGAPAAAKRAAAARVQRKQAAGARGEDEGVLATLTRRVSLAVLGMLGVEDEGRPDANETQPAPLGASDTPARSEPALDDLEA